MYRRLVQGIVVALLALGSIGFVAPQSARATFGGGCSTRDPRINSCISYSGDYVIGDFYMNGYPDSSYAWGCMEIHTTTHGISYYTCERLNRNGRFPVPPKKKVVSSYGGGRGQAFTRVRIYTWDWRIHGYVDSPKLNYS